MKFTSYDLKYFEKDKKEIKNGEVLLLNNIGKGIQAKQYNVISELDDNDWNFYILLDRKNDDTVGLCQLMPYQNNDEWPFSPIIINTLDNNGKLITKQYQPNLDAITNYHTVFNLSYYYFTNQNTNKRNQENIKTFYGLAANEPRIEQEILQVLNDSNNKFPLPINKQAKIKKIILKKTYLQSRWVKKENINLNSTVITTNFTKIANNQSLVWSAEEFIILKNKINNESENNKRKIINDYIMFCLKPFIKQLILTKINIKAQQKVRNTKIINTLTNKLLSLEQQVKNNIKQSSNKKKIKKIKKQIKNCKNILIKAKINNTTDKKNIKFSKQLLTVVNKEQQFNDKKKIVTKNKWHCQL